MIAEIETDKATMEFEAVDEGTVGKILVAEGTEGVKVNDLIAILLEEGESADAHRRGAGEAERRQALPADGRKGRRRRAGRRGRGGPPLHRRAATRVFASPLARRIAADKGLDLAAIKGSGPNGRIVKADVESAKPGAAAQPRPAPAGTRAPAAAAPAVALAPRPSRRSTPTASSRRSSSTACARPSRRA